MIRIIDEFVSDNKFYSVEEYQNKIDEGYNPTSSSKFEVLGVVEGKSFVLDGVSRNGRFYAKELWENALSDNEVKEMLRDRLMFGCIGHPENYTLDELLQDGKVSHIVTDLKLGKDGYGYARYEILDTPAGRILKTVLSAGSKMKVSTRGFGEFVNEAKEIDGKRYQVINPKTFKLESIDFVIKPGIADVDVKLIEKLEEENNEDIEKLKESKIHLCEDGVCTLIEGIELHKKLTEELEKYKKIVKNLSEENDKLQDEVLKKDDKEVKDDKGSEKNDYENLTNETLLKFLNSIIEKYVKENNLIKEKEKIIEKMLKFINTDNTELTIENLDELEEVLNNDEFLTEAKKIISIIKNNSEKVEKSDFDNLLDKNSNLIIKQEQEKSNEALKNLEESYNEIIKDLGKKLIETENEKNKILESFNLLKENFISEIEEKNELLKSIEEKNKLLEKSVKTLKSNNEKLNTKNNELSSKNEELVQKISETEKSKQLLENKLATIKETQSKIIESEVSKKLYEERKKIEEKIHSEYNEKINSIEEKLNTKNNELVKENNSLKQKVDETFETIEKLQEELNKSNEMITLLENEKTSQLNNLNETLEKENKIIETLEESNVKLSNEVNEYKLKYLESLYKLDKKIISETLNKFDDINKVKQVLENMESEKSQSLYETMGYDLQISKQEKTKKKKSLAEKLV